MPSDSRMSFWHELKRRKVVKAAMAYAALGWLLVQVAATVFPILRLPQGGVWLITVLTLIGFPLTLLLAWIYEITPAGIRRADDAAPGESIARETGRGFYLAVIGALGLAVAFLVLDNYILDAASPTPASTTSTRNVLEKAVAVLPFTDLSEGNDQSWLADGLTEEILNSLAQSTELLVTARTSSFQFKDQNRDISEIAAALRVEYVVEGSLRRIGDRLRIAAQLIRARDGSHLWSQQYDRTTADILDIEHDVAESIATALDIVLDDELRVRMFRSGTRNVEAFLAFQEGMAVYRAAHTDSKPTLWDANVHFERALALDPSYAAAARAHSDAFAHQIMLGPREDAPGDRRYTQDEAHARLLADLELAAEHAETPTAKIETELVRELFSPTWYRMPRLIDELRKAWDQRNISPTEPSWTNQILLLTGNTKLARTIAEGKLEADPLNPDAWVDLIDTEIRAGDLGSARRLIGDGRRNIGDHPALREAEMIVLAREGQRDDVIALRRGLGRNDALLAALTGDYETAGQMTDEADRRSAWPRIELLIPYYEIGAFDRVRLIANRIDSLPAGPALLAAAEASDGQLRFELGDTPNFLARIREAGIDPASFEPALRLSTVPLKAAE